MKVPWPIGVWAQHGGLIRQRIPPKTTFIDPLFRFAPLVHAHEVFGDGGHGFICGGYR
jgi:hypothetical protein